MILIFYLWIGLACILMLLKPKWGVALGIPYMVIVPFLNLNIFNYAFLLILLFNYKFRKRRINWRPFMPFVFFYLAFLFIMPFQSDTPLSWELNFWRGGVIGCLTIPVFISMEVEHDPMSIKLFRNSILFSIIVACVYGLCLTQWDGINPYLFLMASLSGDGDVTTILRYSEDAGGARLFGRIYSCFEHPMLFAIFLGFSFIYLFCSRKKMAWYLFFPIILIVVLNMVLCGVRSVIGGMIVAIVYYLLFSGKLKLAIIIGLFLFFGWKLIDFMPDVKVYLGSIGDTSGESEVGGSSLNMRLEQLDGCFREINDSWLFGKGYEWNKYYLNIKGDHPILLAFESLIFVVLCNGGLVGLGIWGVFVLLVLRTNKRMMGRDRVLYDSLLFFYISYCCITGEYGYMKLYALFYTLMICENYHIVKARNA